MLGTPIHQIHVFGPVDYSVMLRVMICHIFKILTFSHPMWNHIFRWFVLQVIEKYLSATAGTWRKLTILDVWEVDRNTEVDTVTILLHCTAILFVNFTQCPMTLSP